MSVLSFNHREFNCEVKIDCTGRVIEVENLKKREIYKFFFFWLKD